MAQYLDLEGTKILANKIKENKNNKLDKTGGTVTGQTIFNQGTTVKNINSGGGTAGYMYIAQIKINGTYLNQPITFDIHQRERWGRIFVKFASANSNDPALTYINKIGNITAYIYKVATSTWNLYVQKSEEYDSIDIVGFSKGEYMKNLTVTWQGATVTSLPSGYVSATNATIDMNVTNAVKLQTTRNIALTGTITGNANFDGSGNININTTPRDFRINNTFATNFRQQVKGDTKSGPFLAPIRNDTAGVANSPQYGTGIGFGMADTHGYLYANNSTAQAFIGAGNAGKLNWTKQLAFTDSNVASATKLQTARNINGVAFDGTRDITVYDSTKVLTSNNSSTAIHADADASSTTEFMSLKAGGNELKITSSGGGSNPAKNVNNLTYNGNLVYHAGRKPTPNEIGAYPKSEIDTKLNGKANSSHTHDDRYYTETEINNKLSTINTNITQLSNPNLLINSDFQVWQRGTSFKAIDYSQKYGADRWKLFGNLPDDNWVKSDGLQMNRPTGGTGVIRITQFLENFKFFSDKDMTLSLYGTGSADLKIYINKDEVPTYIQTIEMKTRKAYYSVTFNVGDLSSTSKFGVMLQGDGNYVLQYVKLELGSKATPFVPRSFGEELALCQRYYEVGYTNFIAVSSWWLTGTINLVPKRVNKPTIKIESAKHEENKVNNFLSGNTVQQSITNIKITDDLTCGNNGIHALYCDNGFVKGEAYSFYYKVDSEIY